MILVEKHNINKSNSDWKQIDHLCFLSKNLYNHALYTIKQHFNETSKVLRYKQVDKLMQLNENYSLLPNNTSQQILMVLDKNIKSYFALLKMWKKNKKSLNGCPKFPKYKDKIKGRNLLVFTYQQFRLRDNKILLPKKCKLSNVTTKQNNIKLVRIIPQSDSYKIEVIYDKAIKENKNLTEKYASIDLGVNNLALIAIQNKPIIINGRPLKAINQYYNKKRASIQSKITQSYINKKGERIQQKTSKKLSDLTKKRNNKIEDYLHKKSRIVVDCLVKNKITKLVIGHNIEWKQEVNLGKRNNQIFVSIPFNKFIDMLKYKCELEGINVTIREESYTSKCSSLDLEELKYQNKYLGRRIKRGMFISSKGIKINADLNGALNILRKETGDKVFLEMKMQTQSSRGQVVWPVKI